ncbi:MAG: glycerol-3-phosphate 1-O-acyltransferase PlsY [Deferribacteraceae bacterium]|jgi:glycerol-3-phosphate acyltransferase PlsY|nr:glycerol-3-phosphate 1-O-acyltransferase PlsY [Deferribacteraceae bacterium]
MFHIVTGILFTAGCYLIGSIPVAYILVKVISGADIRSVGSGNVGATNAGRVLGKPGFVLVLILDTLKGFLPIFLSLKLCQIYGFPRDIPLFCAMAVILGHAFPIYLGFSGGKGVAASLGVFIALAPIPVLGAASTFLLSVFFTRMVSVGSMLAAIVNAIMIFILYSKWQGLCVFATLVALFVIYKHRGNIKRILAGTENKVFNK